MDLEKYLAFWGWKSLPWNEPIELNRLFWQDQTQATCSRLMLSLQRTASINVITAPPGHGKSTLARWLYHRIDPKQQDVAFFSLLHTKKASGWLLPKLAQYLGLNPKTSSSREILKHLQDSRLHQRLLTVVIDDAHKLTGPEALDEILSLSQAQSVTSNHLNFILIGNPRLWNILQATEGVQHRLSLYADLQGLKRTEVVNYLNWRIEMLNLPNKLLQPDAQAFIANQTPYSFASLESLFQGALMEAFLHDQTSITVDAIQRALLLMGLQKTAQEAGADGQRSSKSNLPRRKVGPSTQSKIGGSEAQALDLNSLYYKSTDGHDPEDA
ncbi:MAG: ATP-binding protein [Proteobacteria bacterium]|nr:ATP-binding protein [Pseudomonadota bacterium]